MSLFVLYSPVCVMPNATFGTATYKKYALIIGWVPSVTLDLLHTFVTDGYICLGVFAKLVKGFTTIASEEVPKSIA